MDLVRWTKRFSTLCLSGLLVAACTPGVPISGAEADAAVGETPDGSSINGNLDGGGLGLVFVIKRGLPSEHDHNGYEFTFEIAEMKIMNLRLVADSVADGDERTTEEIVEARWSDERVTVPVLYPDAPPGMYSKVRGTIVEFVVDGEVQLSDNQLYDLDVELEEISVPFEMSVDRNLEIGEPLVLQVDVDLFKAIGEVDFDDLDIVDDEVVLDDDSSAALDGVLQKLSESLMVVGDYIE